MKVLGIVLIIFAQSAFGKPDCSLVSGHGKIHMRSGAVVLVTNPKTQSEKIFSISDPSLERALAFLDRSVSFSAVVSDTGNILAFSELHRSGENPLGLQALKVKKDIACR